MVPEKTSNGTGGATLISAGTTPERRYQQQNDLRGTVIGNVSSSAKIVISANGVVEGTLPATRPILWAG